MVFYETNLFSKLKLYILIFTYILDTLIFLYAALRNQPLFSAFLYPCFHICFRYILEGFYMLLDGTNLNFAEMKLYIPTFACISDTLISLYAALRNHPLFPKLKLYIPISAYISDKFISLYATY